MSTKPDRVMVMRASRTEQMMCAVMSAQQYEHGGKIALMYIDGSVEIGASHGRLLESFGTFFSAVRHVQEQRPDTMTTVPEALGPSTMLEVQS